MSNAYKYLRQWCGGCLLHLDVHCILGYHLLQLPIFFFQLTPYLDVADFQVCVFHTPVI